MLSNRLIGSFVAALASGAAIAGDSFSFTRLIDGNTPIPGGTGNFTHSGPPSISGDSFMFLGYGSSSQAGAYSYSLTSGSLTRLASSGMPVPGGGALFGQFRGFSANTGSAAWVEGGQQFEGVYGWTDGQLRRWVRSSDPFPNGTRRIMNNPSVDGEVVAFLAHTPGGGQGMYFRDGDAGPIISMAETGAPAPGGGTFGSLYQPSTFGHSATFLADAGGRWLYRWQDGVTERVIGPGTPRPGGGTFPSIARAILDQQQIAFVPSGGGGAYLYDRGTITTFADTSTPVPGGVGNFNEITDIALDGGNLLFTGLSENSTRSALYLYSGGDLTRVVGPGDTVDGRVVSQALFRQDEALEGSTIGLLLTYTDGSFGIYSTVIPEPAAGICAIGMLLMLARRS
jgi:hypothetical protein